MSYSNTEALSTSSAKTRAKRAAGVDDDLAGR
jgi:hypothetical protein